MHLFTAHCLDEQCVITQFYRPLKRCDVMITTWLIKALLIWISAVTADVNQQVSVEFPATWFFRSLLEPEFWVLNGKKELKNGRSSHGQ